MLQLCYSVTGIKDVLLLLQESINDVTGGITNVTVLLQ